MPNFEDIVKASERISKYIHKTPVFTSSCVDKAVGRKIFFKCENFQKTGSFKARGALNAVSKSVSVYLLQKVEKNVFW